jgi:HlyD family secretion protein
MNIEAEVYVSDISRVRVGAPVRATGDGFTGSLSGAVQEIGMQVDRSSVFNPDPASFSDKRVVKVRIKLDAGERVRGLVNHQVYVTISP